MDAIISEDLQDLNYHANDDSPPVNLAKALGSLPQIPINALNQAEKHLFLNGSFLRLPSDFYGLEAAPQVKSFFITSVMVLAYVWHQASIT